MATSESPAPRALRVGVILGDNLVEERLFRTQQPITIGQSLRCTLSIPIEGMPHEHVLFAVDQGRLILRVPERMTGRLARGGAIELLETSAARTIPVEHGMRGKLQLGGATLLFQEIAAPPLAPRPQLPASVRGSFADRIDRRLAAIITTSIVAHLGFALYAWSTDRIIARTDQEDPLAEYTPPEVLELPAELVEPDLAPAPADEPGPGVAAPANPRVQTPKPNAPPRLAEPDPGDGARWAQVLTGNTPGTDGQQEIKSRQPGAALDQQIADIKNNNRDVRVGNDPRLRTGDPARRGTGPDGPEINDPRLAQNQPKEEKPPSLRIDLVPRPPTGDPPPTLSAEQVRQRIATQYMPGLQRCYVKHGLSVDPTLSARVKVSFTVTEKGTTDDNSAHGANGEVDTCIAGQMALWRFPIPRDADHAPTDASFGMVLVLRPSL